VRKSVEAVDPHAEIAQALRQRIGRGPLRDRGVEGGVKAGQHHHRPPHRKRHTDASTCYPADLKDSFDDAVECRGELLVHPGRVIPADDHRVVAIPAQQTHQISLGNPGQQRRIGDLETIQVQHGHHRPVLRRVQQLAHMPAGGQRPRLRLPVTDDAKRHQLRVIEHRTERMQQRIAQLTALVEGPRCFRRAMAGTPPGKENCRKNRRIPRSSREMWLYSSLYVPSSQAAAFGPGPPQVALVCTSANGRGLVHHGLLHLPSADLAARVAPLAAELQAAHQSRFPPVAIYLGRHRRPARHL
jgi:hypothetical protein